MGSYTEWVCQLELINSYQNCVRHFCLLKYCSVMNKWIHVQIFYSDSILGFLGGHQPYMWLILDRAVSTDGSWGLNGESTVLCFGVHFYPGPFLLCFSWLLCVKQLCTTKPASMALCVTVCLKKTFFNFSCWYVLLGPRKCSPKSLTVPWNSLTFISAISSFP